jgi:hypothetical protein
MSSTHAHAPELTTLIFSAKIDFVTLITPGKLQLPDIAGTVRWSPKHNWTRFSIHDPSAADIRSVLQVAGQLRMSELEVSVDVSCAPDVPAAARDEQLREVMTNIFARALSPDPRLITGGFRAAYDGFGPKPFNLVLPDADAQLLFGHKTDLAQVKAYYKKTDQRRRLESKDWVARVEVALRDEGLHRHRLVVLGDLLGFRYRKELSGYFRHVKDVTRRELRSSKLKPLHRVLVEHSDSRLKAEFARVGVGTTKPGGKFDAASIRATRDRAVNERIGQALLRLERSLGREIRAQTSASDDE